MNIYIDFDDVICETAREFSAIVKRLFGIEVPYDDINFFDLKKSFRLTDDEYNVMMTEGHMPEILLSYEETPGASETINKWIDSGNEVFIMTGRPFSAYGPSRQWLDEHNLTRVRLICVDKYGRDSFIKNSDFSIKLEEFYRMRFDFAIEDSPAAFKHLQHFTDCRVAVFDRPWNQSAVFPDKNYVRCMGWKDVADAVPQCQ